MLEPASPDAVVLTDLQSLVDCQENFSLPLYLSLTDRERERERERP